MECTSPFQRAAAAWRPAQTVFKDRVNAGNKLALKLIESYGESLRDAVILGCAKGGMGVAKAVADKLELKKYGPTLDTVICRKIGEIAVLTENGEVQPIVNALFKLGIDPESPDFKQQVEQERKELGRLIALYRSGKERPSLANRIVIIVDDGLESGAVAKAAIDSVRHFAPSRIIYATPISSEAGRGFVQLHQVEICSAETVPQLAGEQVWRVADFYNDFSEVSDDHVCRLMRRGRRSGVKT